MVSLVVSSTQGLGIIRRILPSGLARCRIGRMAATVRVTVSEASRSWPDHAAAARALARLSFTIDHATKGKQNSRENYGRSDGSEVEATLLLPFGAAVARVNVRRKPISESTRSG